MQRQMLGGKIHRATVTDANLDYPGSIAIDKDLLKAANILQNEKVLIANLTNGSRIESYCIESPSGSGEICLNGGAAKHGKKGDLVIIIAFMLLTDEEARTYQPHIAYVDAQNKLIPQPV